MKPITRSKKFDKDIRRGIQALDRITLRAEMLLSKKLVIIKKGIE